MSDAINNMSEAIDAQYSHESATTRRRLVGGAAATVAGMTALGMLPDLAGAGRSAENSPEKILTVAATAEVLATIVNTVGREKINLDKQTDDNVATAAREELIHYDVLESLGATPATKRIWVPDAVFANRTNFLETLEVGDQIFVNAYLIGTTTFASKRYRDYKLARATAEFAGVEAVHRALARQSLGKIGNDRVFLRYGDIERAKDAPNVGAEGFFRIDVAVTQLEAAGFGFGKEGSGPGRFYEFDEVRQRTPNPEILNSTTPN